MNKRLDSLAEIVAKANDLFYNKHQQVDTLMGIMDKALRAQGMKADAITIDCVAIDKKIVLVLHDEKPDKVDVAFGNRNGDIFSSSEYTVETLTVETFLELMEANFIGH